MLESGQTNYGHYRKSKCERCDQGNIDSGFLHGILFSIDDIFNNHLAKLNDELSKLLVLSSEFVHLRIL